MTAGSRELFIEKEKKDIWWSQKTRFINAEYCK